MSIQRLLYQGLACTNGRKYMVSTKQTNATRIRKALIPKGRQRGGGRPDFISTAMLEVELLLNEKEKLQYNLSGRHEHSKGWWSYGYVHWNDAEFRKHMKMERTTFEFVLSGISTFIREERTEYNTTPTSSDRKLALTVYRLVHGCSFIVVQNLFGVHESLAR